MNDESPWGMELLLDCSGCNDRILRKEDIEQFSKELVELIDMKAFGEPMAVHFAEHDEKKAGFTLVQPIETSSIVAHFVDADRVMYCNVFSCKEFNPQDVVDFVQKFFVAEKINQRFVYRNAP
jgi:hypothetical protein